METAGDIVKDALSEITAYGAEASIEAVDSQLAIRYMNRMMAAFSVDGIDLGYTNVDSLGDDITVADGAIEGIVAQLAVRLWDQFNEDAMPVPPTLLARANSAKETMRGIAVNIGASEFPNTLPIGSGNEGTTLNDNHFYSDLEEEILAESNGSLGLEDSTA